MIKTTGFAASHFHKALSQKQFTRKDPKEDDVELDVLYCGVCHSDIHQVNNDWLNTVWPCVPGHEIVGRVSRAGESVKNFKVGDLCAVGCIVDSCGKCKSCQEGLENYCESEPGFLATYNGTMNPNGQKTFGGYSKRMVVRERFLLHVPANIELAAVAPILCSGVTTYSPLKRWGAGPGKKVGIVGFGGLGHMATQIAKALGAEVSVITTSPEKEADAKRLGASRVIVSTNKDAMEAAQSSLDLVLSTIPEKHKVEPYLSLLKRDCQLVMVGCLVPLGGLESTKVIMHRNALAGSLIGGIPETQEVLDFCAKNGIKPQIELIAMSEINDAFKKVEKKKVRYRYVIDMATLKDEKLDDLEDIGTADHRLNVALPAKKAA
jgi:uncharacterized zinc-type alcohol dehydrogenase-like protein